MSIYIETDRLILREFVAEDAVEIHKICNEEYILKWMPDWKSSVDNMKEWIKWVKSKYDKATKDTARIMLAVTLKSTNTLVGMVGIGNKEEVDNEIEVAYFISEKFSNNGYTSEATKAIIEWSFCNLDLEYIIAIVELDNYPSKKVIEKCSFENLGIRIILNSGETEEKPFHYFRLYNTLQNNKSLGVK